VRDTVLFPHAVLPLTVGRESSVQLINSLGEDKTIVVVAQREARVDSPQPTDLYTVGSLAVVHKVVKMPNQSLFVFAEGLERVRLSEFTQLAPYMMARVETVPEAIPPKTSEVEALQRNVLTLFQQIVAGSPTLSDELSTVAMNIEEPGRLVDFIASSLPSLSTADKQDTLETSDVRVRLEKVNQHLAKELEVQQLRNKIQSEVQDRVQQSQREYYLREQMKAIQKELGEQDEGQRDTEELRQKIENAGMPDEVKKEALKELGRLSRMSPMAADYGVTRNYIEWLAVLPWAKTSGGEVDIPKAKEILDTDHYDLQKVKDRILDYLSVRRLKPTMKGPILCFVGPPGVGKTSLGRSIARALGRKFVRISLGGVHDEAISVLCPGKSFRAFAVRRRKIQSSCLMKSTRSAATSVEIQGQLCSKHLIRSRTPRSETTTSTCRSICRRCCSSRQPICSTRFPSRFVTAWRSLSCRATQKKKRST
jgi:ATP-dependent Lon protease